MKGKHFKKLHWNKKRMVCAILCVVLLLTSISFSSMAWYTYKKNEVTQVFKGTTLQITMGGGNEGDAFALVPGAKYQLEGDRLPKVTVTANSVDCYVFVLREYFWYDMTYYDSTTSSTIYPIDVMNRALGSPGGTPHNGYYLENDTFKPDRDGNPDIDYGFTDYYPWQQNSGGINVPAYKAGRIDNAFNGSGELPLDIKDSTGDIIGERCLFGYMGLSDPEATPGVGAYATTTGLKYVAGANDNSFSPVFKTSNKDRHLYVLEGNENNCYIQVMDGIGKVQMPTDPNCLPKIRFTAFTVQAEGLTRDQAADLVIEQIRNDSTLGEYLQYN